MIELMGFILTAVASHYSDGVMLEVLHNRQAGNAWVSLPVRLPTYDGLIAVRDCEYLGDAWLLRPVGQVDWERHLVIDCARPPGTDGAFEWMTRLGIMVETSYSTAQRWGSVGGGIQIERLVTERDLK